MVSIVNATSQSLVSFGVSLGVTETRIFQRNKPEYVALSVLYVETM